MVKVPIDLSPVLERLDDEEDGGGGAAMLSDLGPKWQPNSPALAYNAPTKKYEDLSSFDCFSAYTLSFPFI